MELPTGSSGNWQRSRGRGCGAALSHTQTPPGAAPRPHPHPVTAGSLCTPWSYPAAGPGRHGAQPAGAHLGAPGSAALLSPLRLPWACPQADPCLVVRKGRRSCLACTGRTCSGTTWSEATGRCTCPSHPDGRSSFRPGPTPGHAGSGPGHPPRGSPRGMLHLEAGSARGSWRGGVAHTWERVSWGIERGGSSQSSGAAGVGVQTLIPWLLA